MCKSELLRIPPCPGIYKITNIITNKCYIGQSINLKKRLKQHLKDYKYIKSRLLYKSFIKYGIENFSVEILEILDIQELELLKKTLDELETSYIKEYDSFNNGYNMTEGGGGAIGFKHSEITKHKLSTTIKNMMLANPEKFRLKPCYAYNFKEKYFLKGFSRSSLSELIKNKNYEISATTICSCILNKHHYCKDFVFGNSEEECLEKLKFFDTDKAKHSAIFAPNYEEYLEYLKTIVDKNGYLPKIEEISRHFNKAPTTIVGWNKHIKEYIRLDKSHNRLMLIGFTNPDIEYNIEEFNNKLKSSAYLYDIVDTTKNVTVLTKVSKHEASKFFNIKPETFSDAAARTIKNGSLYRKIYKIILL